MSLFKRSKTIKKELTAQNQKPAVASQKPIGRQPEIKSSTGTLNILLGPIISEKATALLKDSQYVFKVAPQANKIQIKQAVQNLYNVKVQSVNISKIPGKARRRGQTMGWHSGFKKAIVRLIAGQKIESLI